MMRSMVSLSIILFRISKNQGGVPREAKFKYEVGGGLFGGALSASLRGLKSQQSRAQAGALGTMPPHSLRPVGEK